MVLVEEIFSDVGYLVKEKGCLLRVHYKLTFFKYMIATIISSMLRLNVVDEYLCRGSYYEYYILELK